MGVGHDRLYFRRVVRHGLLWVLPMIVIFLTQIEIASALTELAAIKAGLDVPYHAEVLITAESKSGRYGQAIVQLKPVLL
jgi:hypothetical protein